jgi:hypothetical protein
MSHLNSLGGKSEDYAATDEVLETEASSTVCDQSGATTRPKDAPPADPGS